MTEIELIQKLSIITENKEYEMNSTLKIHINKMQCLSIWKILHGIVANVLDCDIKVSSNSSCTITCIFEIIPLGKVGASLYSHLWVK